MSRFGLGRARQSRTRRTRPGRLAARAGGLHALTRNARRDGRITRWLGAFLVTTDHHSLQDRMSALETEPIARQLYGPLVQSMPQSVISPLTRAGWRQGGLLAACILSGADECSPSQDRGRHEIRDGHSEAQPFPSVG